MPASIASSTRVAPPAAAALASRADATIRVPPLSAATERDASSRSADGISHGARTVK